MKKTIRLHERDLHRVISESVRRILSEVKIDYGKSSGSSRDWDWDSNPNNDRGFDYDEDLEYTDEINEDYIGFAQRLERLTKTEWSIQPSSYYRSSHNATGYDSFSESYGDSLLFSSQVRFSSRTQQAQMLDLIEKITKAFFGDVNATSVNYDSNQSLIFVYVQGYHPYGGANNYIKGHKHGREIKYGKDYAGYPKPKGSRVTGYNHPYPNPKNSEGNFKLSNWNRFMNGEQPLTYDQWANGNKPRPYSYEEPDYWEEY